MSAQPIDEKPSECQNSERLKEFIPPRSAVLLLYIFLSPIGRCSLI